MVNNTLNSAYFNSLLTKVGFNNKEYADNPAGYCSFLSSKGIKLRLKKEDEGWQYYGIDTLENNFFTEDFTYYKSNEECLITGIIECYSYLSLKLNNGK